MIPFPFGRFPGHKIKRHFENRLPVTIVDAKLCKPMCCVPLNMSSLYNILSSNILSTLERKFPMDVNKGVIKILGFKTTVHNVIIFAGYLALKPSH